MGHTKLKMALKIAEETYLTKGEVRAIIQKTFDFLVACFERGENVELRNFGVFKVKVRKSRPGHNPKNIAQKVITPSRRTVTFKPSRLLRRKLNP